MIVNLQLVSQRQDASVLALLNFPQPPLLPPDTQLRVKRKTKGSVKYDKFQYRDAESYIKRLSEGTLNTLEITYRFKPSLAAEGIFLETMFSRLRLSPTNALWSDKDTWLAPTTYAGQREYLSTASRSAFIADGILVPYPSFFQIFLSIRTDKPQQAVLGWLYQALQASIPPCLIDSDTYGCADLLGDEAAAVAFLYSVEAKLAGWRGAFRLLGRRFDGLHSILFGETGLCEIMARTAERVTASTKVERGERCPFGMILLPDEMLSEDKRSLLSNCLVPLDETTRDRDNTAKA